MKQISTQPVKNRPIELTKAQKALVNKEFIPHMDALYNFAYHLTGYNEEAANDIVQDALLKACRFVDKYQKETNAKAWLFRILKNSFINHYRKNQRNPEIATDIATLTGGKNEGVTYLHDSSKTPGDGTDYDDKDLSDEVSKAMSRLNPKYRAVVTLSELEGFTYEEISNILDLRIGTVRSRLFRGRNILKEELYSYALDRGFKDNRSKD